MSREIPFSEIGKRLGCHGVTAAKAVLQAQQLRGLLTEDDRTRYSNDVNGREHTHREAS